MNERIRELFVKKLRLITFTTCAVPNCQRQPNHPAHVRKELRPIGVGRVGIEQQTVIRYHPTKRSTTGRYPMLPVRKRSRPRLALRQ